MPKESPPFRVGEVSIGDSNTIFNVSEEVALGAQKKFQDQLKKSPTIFMINCRLLKILALIIMILSAIIAVFRLYIQKMIENNSKEVKRRKRTK